MKTRPVLFLLIPILITGMTAVYNCGGGGGGGNSPPAGPTGITVLGAGTHHAGFVEDGRIWLWGNNDSSQTGTLTISTINLLTPTQTDTDTDWRSLSMGLLHSLGVKENGTLWGWGGNGFGQLGTDTSVLEITSPSQIGTGTSWERVSAGESFSTGLKTDGTIWTWGRNDSGQLGTNTGISQLTIPSRVGTDADWDTVVAGVRHVLALGTDGTLWAWGNNAQSQCGTDTGGANITAPVQVSNSTSWMLIAPGDRHSLALKTDGTLWAWGSNDSGVLGTTGFGSPYFTSPIRIGTDSDWVAISAGYDHSLGIKVDGTLWAWGENDYGQLGTDVNISEIWIPSQMGTGSNWTLVAAGDGFSVAARDDGTVWSWGHNPYGQLGNGVMGNKNNQAIVSTMSASPWASILPAAGLVHTLALKTDGTLWAWGSNNHGQVGTSSQEAWQEPVQVGNDSDWSFVNGGGNSSFAIKDDDTLWAWGSNTSWKLGTTGGPSGTPFMVGSDADWDEVSSGFYHTLALKTGGTLWAWGRNTYGQCGTDTGGASISTPAQIGTAINWVSVAAGEEHSLGLKADGTLWGWGRNVYGQAGTDLSVTQVTTPSRIGTATDWDFVAAGANHSIALKTDYTAWAWGNGRNGQLGSGYLNKSTPTQVNTVQTFTFVCGGGQHTLGINTSGWLYGWGANYQGQLGNNFGHGDTYSPSNINTTTIRKYVACGQQYSIAFNTGDGNLWAWGENWYGQIGDGTAWVTTPQQIY